MDLGAVEEHIEFSSEFPKYKLQTHTRQKSYLPPHA